MADNASVPPKVVATDVPPPGKPPEPSSRVDEVGEVNLVYQIEGQPNDVPVFELARTLEALGHVIQEADQVVYHDQHEVIDVNYFTKLRSGSSRSSKARLSWIWCCPWLTIQQSCFL
jgi:hypothetical protein